MKKLVILRAGRQIQEVALDKQITTIGRQKESDVWLDDVIVSRHHAQLVFSDEGVPYIEDLDSGNGVLYKGKRTKRIPMRHGDVVHIGAFMLRYEALEDTPEVVHQDFADKTQIFSSWGAAKNKAPSAVIKYVTGPQAGNIFDLRNPYTAIGLPGKQGAVITRRQDGFYIRPLSEQVSVVLNEQAISAITRLKDKMHIMVDSVELEFHLVAFPGGA